MSEQPKDGGLAFGGKRWERVFSDEHANADGVSAYAEATHPGMTLRDYFAAQAMVAVVANESIMNVLRMPLSGEYLESNPRIARMCYSMADTMLAERAK